MIGPPDKRDRLLSDLFQGADSSALALRAAQATRRRRAARRSAIVASVLVTLSTFCFWRSNLVSDAKRSQDLPQVLTKTIPSGHHNYEEISDAEALSLLSNRAVLITQEQGQTKVILLGQFDSR